MEYIEVAKINEFPKGSKKYIEHKGHEILLVNVDGNVHAISNRCGHMNVSLEGGEFKGNIITCPMHHAEYDVTIGKNVKDPKFPKMLTATKIGKMMANITVHDQKVYEVMVEGNAIKIGI